MSGLYLVAAVASETTGTFSLRLASDGRGLRRYGLVMAGCLGAFTLLALALKEGLALGATYGIWSAGGMTVVAIASRFLFGEPLIRTAVVGIALIMAGVPLVELDGTHWQRIRGDRKPECPKWWQRAASAPQPSI